MEIKKTDAQLKKEEILKQQQEQALMHPIERACHDLAQDLTQKPLGVNSKNVALKLKECALLLKQDRENETKN